MTSQIWGIIWEECQHLAVQVKITKEAWELGQLGRRGSRDVFGNILEHLDLRDLQGCQIFMKLD